MRERFVRAVTIEAPVERVFGFHESPDALARLLPPWERAEVLEPPHSLAVGTRVRMRMRVGPVPVVCEAEHTEYERNKLFADRLVRGPFRYWYHRHRFEPLGPSATRLIDEVEYELPGGALGALIARRMVARRLARMFDYRHAVTRAACEGAG